MNSTLAPIAPTQAQIDYLMNLVSQLAEYVDQAKVEEMREGYRQMYRERTLTKSTISDEIKGMYPLIKLAKERAAARGQEVRKSQNAELAGQVPAGRYAVTGNEDQTVFVHVVKYDDGAFVVKQQIGDDTQRVYKSVARVLLQKILDAGIEESSMRYGRELGTCGVCGRTLTNEDSRELGIGPVCRSKIAG